MSEQVIVAFIGLLGVVIGALPTYFYMRAKNTAEVGKLKAETAKLNAEAEKIRAELPAGYIGEGENKSSIRLPREYTFGYVARREALTLTQGNILKYMVRLSHAGQYVAQNTLEREFNQMRNSELFYRLECLRLLGFLESQKTGQNVAGSDRFSYRLSEDYRKEIGDPETFCQASAST